MIEEAILAALHASLGNSEALTTLGLVEFCLAEEPGARCRQKLADLIDKWGQTLVGVDACDLERLKRELANCGETS